MYTRTDYVVGSITTACQCHIPKRTCLFGTLRTMPAYAVKRNSLWSPQSTSAREESTAWKKRLRSFCCPNPARCKPCDVSDTSLTVRSNELESVERESFKHCSTPPLLWYLHPAVCLVSKLCRQELRKHPLCLLKLCGYRSCPAAREHARIILPQRFKY